MLKLLGLDCPVTCFAQPSDRDVGSHNT